MYFEALSIDAYKQNLYVFLLNCFFHLYEALLFISSNASWYYNDNSLLHVSICKDYLFLSLFSTFKNPYFNMCLLWVAFRLVILRYPIWQSFFSIGIFSLFLDICLGAELTCPWGYAWLWVLLFWNCIFHLLFPVFEFFPHHRAGHTGSLFFLGGAV